MEEVRGVACAFRSTIVSMIGHEAEIHNTSLRRKLMWRNAERKILKSLGSLEDGTCNVNKHG